MFRNNLMLEINQDSCRIGNLKLGQTSKNNINKAFFTKHYVKSTYLIPYLEKL